MDINFKTTKLKRLCNNSKHLIREYGHKQATRILIRLQQLAAADTLQDISKLPQLRCHELKGNRKGQLAVDLIHPYRLIFKVYQEPIPEKDSGGLDWEQVYTIMIHEIEDYHG